MLDNQEITTLVIIAIYSTKLSYNTSSRWDLACNCTACPTNVTPETNSMNIDASGSPLRYPLPSLVQNIKLTYLMTSSFWRSSSIFWTKVDKRYPNSDPLASLSMNV
jgi:hypothetical protein